MLKNQEDLKGIRGWLAVLGFSIIIVPIIFVGDLFELISTLDGYMEDGTWKLLTTSSSEYYNPILVILILEELIFGCIFTVAFVYIAHLFFSKHYLFPKIFIYVHTIQLIYLVIHFSLLYYLLAEEVLDKETQKNIYTAFLYYFVWVTYVVKSKRVEATFVEKKSKKSKTDPES